MSAQRGGIVGQPERIGTARERRPDPDHKRTGGAIVAEPNPTPRNLIPEEIAEHKRQSSRRVRARKRGENVPKLKTGPPKGICLPPEVVARRKKPFGPANAEWMGAAASRHAGRLRAQRLYKKIGSCEHCGGKSGRKPERHHKDENTHNNTPENIAILCRACHAKEHVRLRRSECP